jgi:hypothetical protein
MKDIYLLGQYKKYSIEQRNPQELTKILEWASQSSGNVIPEKILIAIEKLWQRNANSKDGNDNREIVSDILSIIDEGTETEREALVNSRIGQGIFRENLIKII